MALQVEARVLVPGPAVGEEPLGVDVEAAGEHVAHSGIGCKDMEEVASAGEGHNVDIGIRLAVAEVRSE